MTQREEIRAQIRALQDEVAELRKQNASLAVSMAQLAASHPVQYVPCVAPYVPPTPFTPWAPIYTSPNTCQSVTVVPGEVTAYN